MRFLWPELWKVVLPDLDEPGRRDIAAFQHHPVDFLPQLPKALEWANEPVPFDVQVQRTRRRSRHFQGGDLLRPMHCITRLFVFDRLGCVRHDGLPPSRKLSCVSSQGIFAPYSIWLLMCTTTINFPLQPIEDHASAEAGGEEDTGRPVKIILFFHLVHTPSGSHSRMTCSSCSLGGGVSAQSGAR